LKTKNLFHLNKLILMNKKTHFILAFVGILVFLITVNLIYFKLTLSLASANRKRSGIDKLSNPVNVNNTDTAEIVSLRKYKDNAESMGTTGVSAPSVSRDQNANIGEVDHATNDHKHGFAHNNENDHHRKNTIITENEFKSHNHKEESVSVTRNVTVMENVTISETNVSSTPDSHNENNHKHKHKSAEVDNDNTLDSTPPITPESAPNEPIIQPSPEVHKNISTNPANSEIKNITITNTTTTSEEHSETTNITHSDNIPKTHNTHNTDSIYDNTFGNSDNSYNTFTPTGTTIGNSKIESLKELEYLYNNFNLSRIKEEKAVPIAPPKNKISPEKQAKMIKELNSGNIKTIILLMIFLITVGFALVGFEVYRNYKVNQIFRQENKYDYFLLEEDEKEIGIRDI
jgi:hypothetical protein